MILLKKSLNFRPSIMLILFCLLSSFVSVGQKKYSSHLTSEQELNFHMHKHTKLKKTGNIMLGGGLLMTTAGVVLFVASDGGFNTEGLAGVGAAFLGAAMIITSVPLYLVSNSHKTKAELIRRKLDGQSVSQLAQFYSDRHLKLKRTGWILLGGGLAVSLVFPILGVPAMIAGGTTLIIAGDNKRKSYLYMNAGNAALNGNIGNNMAFMSMGLRVNF